jgi:hypothetical protein
MQRFQSSVIGTRQRRQTRWSTISAHSSILLGPRATDINYGIRSSSSRSTGQPHQIQPPLHHHRLSGISSSSIALTKVLIANRGEIACRVLRTCRDWGIPTVAIYSSADGPQALHATMADEAYRVGTGPTPAESYLRHEEILALAVQTGADAIHPGCECFFFFLLVWVEARVCQI